jgi:hypothetical protein
MNCSLRKTSHYYTSVCNVVSCMNVLRRGFAAAALRSMPHSRPAMLTPPSPRSQPVPALFLSNIRAFNSRMLSTAPGTGDNAQSSSKTSSSSEGDRQASGFKPLFSSLIISSRRYCSGSANDDDAVKKVGPRRWKWLGALAVITGTPLLYETSALICDYLLRVWMLRYVLVCDWRGSRSHCGACIRRLGKGPVGGW